MENKGMKQKSVQRMLKAVAVMLVAVLVLPIVSPSILGILNVLAEENPALARIYSILSDAVDEPQTCDDYYELANIAIGRREYETALGHLEEARKLAGPEETAKTGELWLKSASVYSLMGDYESAMPCLDAAIESDPTSAQALLLRAQLLINAGDYEAACRDMKAYVGLNPADTATWVTLAQLYEGLGNYEQARQEYEALYAADAQNHSYLLNALRCGFLVGDYEQTSVAFEDYLNQNPEADPQYRSVAQFLRAACLMQLGQLEQALVGFEQAKESGYDAASCYEQMVLCSYDSGKLEEVLRYGGEMLSQQMQPAGADIFYQRMGAAAMQLERYEEAVEYLDQSILANPELPGSHYYRGASLLGLMRYEEAAADFGSSIEKNFLVQHCYYNRGVCRVQLLDYENAIEDFALTLETGEDETLIQAARDLLWQLASYYEIQSAAAGAPAE